MEQVLEGASYSRFIDTIVTYKNWISLQTVYLDWFIDEEYVKWEKKVGLRR